MKETNLVETEIINADVQEIDESDFISNDFLTERRGNQPVSSTMFDSIFIMGNRIPKELIDSFVSSPEEIEKLITGTVPIFQTNLQRNWWKENERGYSSLNVDIYGAICLADDRHLLDVIIAHGTMINDASKYTLRQVSEGLGLQDVAWEHLNPDVPDINLLNRGIYFHISFKDIFRGMGIKSLKKNREKIMERLSRLSIMHLVLTPVLNGNTINDKAKAFSLIDKEYFALLDKKEIRNGIFKNGTYTDLIVNISEYYVSSLSDDGKISRKRLKNHYVHLVGRNNIEDLYKSFDVDHRTYLHGKTLKFFIKRYFDSKMSLFGINKNFKLNQLFNQIVDSRQKLIDHFGIILKPIDNSSNPSDYYMLHIDTLKKESQKVK
jgi:hypothetical protein